MSATPDQPNQTSEQKSQIPQQQNQKHQLDRLCAISQLYLQAKRLLGINMFLSVPSAIAWAGIVAAFPALNIYAAIWGIGVTLLSLLWLTPAQKESQKKAAKIQHLFDCELFCMDWQAFNIGRPPSPETIAEANSQYRRGHSDSHLKDWYPVAVGQLRPDLARLVCQRTNCWWDASLRRRYAAWSIAIVAILALVLLLIGLIGGLTLEKFFLVVLAPLLPALILGITQYRENMQAAAKLDQLREKAEEIWSRALRTNEPPEVLHNDSVKLQDAIFDNRSTSPLIFNWFYKMLRDEKQALMNKAAEDLVQEAKLAEEEKSNQGKL